MSNETGDIKQAIKDYYEREIEENNLVYKGRIDALHKWRDEDLERLSELERRAEAFDEIYEEYKKEVKTLEELRQSKDMRRVVREVMEKYESEAE